MTELQRIEINEKTVGEVEPEDKKTEEVEKDAPDSEGAVGDGDSGEAADADPERPSWLPTKFKSAEDMAEAYSSLEKKMGEGTEEADGGGMTAIEEASKEFFDKGELSEETYESLGKAGFSRSLVDSYAAGQSALVENQQAAIKHAANGDYDAMSAWAAENLSDDELTTFNDAVERGTLDQATFAVSGLYARYKGVDAGDRPKLVAGGTTGSSVMPFQSMQEVTRAMADPRYKQGEKGYHAEVDRRLAVSNL